MLVTRRRTIQKRKLPDIPQDSTSNPGRLRITRKEHQWCVYRETNQSTTIADSIHSLVLQPKHREHINLLSGSEDLTFQNESDEIQCLQDIYKSCSKILNNMALMKKTSNTYEIIDAVKKYLFEKYPSDHFRKLDIVFNNGVYGLNIREEHSFDGFYWISITWLMEQCINDKERELCYQTIAMLQKYCNIQNIGGGYDEDYIERQKSELEYFEDEFRNMEGEKENMEYQIYVEKCNELKENIDHVKNEIACYECGEYDVACKSIQLWRKLTLEQFEKNVKKHKSPTKIHQWLIQCIELIKSGFKLHDYDIDGDDIYENGEVGIDTMVRFIYNRLNGPLHHICNEIEDSANNCGVASMILSNPLTSKQQKCKIPEDLKLMLHVMNFEDIYEKWN